jgi:hypothetical protein
MGLDCQGYTIVELRPHGVQGEKKLGRHIRLGFNVEMNIIATPPENRGGSATPSSTPAPISLHSISGRISAQTTKPLIALGHLYTDSPAWVNTYTQEHREYLTMYVDLAPDQIEALEEYRGGAGLSFLLNIMVLTQRQEDVGMKAEHIVFTVNQSAWIDILKQVGYGDFLLFEIPALPKATAETDYIACLTEARQHLWLGQYDDAVEDCRKALACYWTMHGLGKDITRSERSFCTKKSTTTPTAAQDQSDDNDNSRNGMLKNERLLFLHRAVKHLTDAAAHREGKPRQPFTRREALGTMNIVAALLAMGDWNETTLS